jgi:CheY-like chemotaxis protein/HPt (histidine-containing phosphotransfer) domain-containing protein
VGSTFHVDLVFEAAEGTPAVTHVTGERGEVLFDPELALRFPLSILVAEDNPINQRVAEGMLSKLGYRPDMVGNGIEAVEAVRRQHYDLIFMDMRMPVMDGMAATRAIRDQYRERPPPCIIALTASIVDIDSRSIREIGLDDLVLKPVTPGSMMQAIVRMQARNQESRPGHGPGPVEGRNAEPDAIDWAAFDALASLLGSEELDEILDLFLGRTLEQFDELSAAIIGSDWSKVRALGHELTPVCATLGALALSGMTREIEQIAAGGGSPEAVTLGAAMTHEAERVRVAMQRCRDSRTR